MARGPDGLSRAENPASQRRITVPKAQVGRIEELGLVARSPELQGRTTHAATARAIRLMRNALRTYHYAALDYLLLIDHDNVVRGPGDLAALLDSWLSVAPRPKTTGVSDVLLRSYGGWWYGSSQSESRHRAALLYAEDCPALRSIGGHFWRVRFEFADTLIERNVESPVEIRSTFAMRAAPPLSFGQLPSVCNDDDCEARRLKKWFYRRRGCTRANCERAFGELWRHSEQKQVDMHLALDLISLVGTATVSLHVALATDDSDLLPAMAVAAASNPTMATVWHLRNRDSSTYLDPVLEARGVRVVRVGGDG